MIQPYVRFALDDIQSCAPDPPLSECLGKRVGVNERPSGRVYENGSVFHLL